MFPCVVHGLSYFQIKGPVLLVRLLCKLVYYAPLLMFVPNDLVNVCYGIYRTRNYGCFTVSLKYVCLSKFMYCVRLGLIYQHLGWIKLQLLRRTTIRAHPLDNTTFF